MTTVREWIEAQLDQMAATLGNRAKGSDDAAFIFRDASERAREAIAEGNAERAAEAVMHVVSRYNQMQLLDDYCYAAGARITEQNLSEANRQKALSRRGRKHKNTVERQQDVRYWANTWRSRARFVQLKTLSEHVLAEKAFAQKHPDATLRVVCDDLRSLIRSGDLSPIR